MSRSLIVALFLVLPCRPQQRLLTDADRIRQLIGSYAAAVDAADTNQAAQVWDNSPDVSFIHPLGEAHGWDEIQRFFTDIMGRTYRERKLVPRDIEVHVYRDAAWSEFQWHFTATQRKDGQTVETDGRETQIYRKAKDRWVLVHVHYSTMPPSR